MLPSTAEKPRYVAEMFARIAPRYDLMNTLMTLGQDARWRRTVADAVLAQVRAQPRSAVLDVGTGTGRLAQAVLAAIPGSTVVGVDYTVEMLRRAPRELARAAGDALQLPFADTQFDAVVSGFVMRNLADIERGIAEQVRVLRPGGMLVILETTPGPRGIFGVGYRFYFRRLVPLLGRLIARDAVAYTYLPESTLAFVEPCRLAALLRGHGLGGVQTRRMAMGGVAITLGHKPASA